MSWRNVNFDDRLKSTRLLWVLYLLSVLSWTMFYGDLTHVEMIAQQPWILAQHEILKWLSDKTMYFLYIFFIGMLIWGYRSQQAQLRIIGWGYLIAQGIGSIVIVRTLKMTLGHARPDHLAKTSNGVFDAWTGPSLSSAYHGFPSGHTCDYLISGFFLAMCLPKTWMRVLAILLAAFNGTLRVLLAKHFPLDVLGGVLIGGITCLAVWQYWILPRLNTP